MSADRRPFFGPLERRALIPALACAACVGFEISEPSTHERSPARFIEGFCAGKAYELEGSAKRTTGVTNDSCGFSVGPSDGAVRFIVQRTDISLYAYYQFEALLADKDGAHAGWVELAEEAHTTTTVAFTVTPQSGKQTRIVDVRLEGERMGGDGTGCSIARRATWERLLSRSRLPFR